MNSASCQIKDVAKVVITAGESAGKAMSRIYSNIGFRGLWNGLPVRIAMIGTLSMSFMLMTIDAEDS